jgi:hypothetical protein
MHVQTVRIRTIDGTGAKDIETIFNPDKCPVCHHHCLPTLITAFAVPHPSPKVTERAQVVYKCPKSDCSELFIADYILSYALELGPGVFGMVGLVPVSINYAEDIRSKNVEKISPRFYRIYKQALEAQVAGLDEIAGPGFRKSLEILVKDFLAHETPTNKDKILATPLGDCIKNLVDYKPLKLCFERAAWLGNDETHYVRKWDQHDIEDLKALIKLGETWIESVEQTKYFENSMQDPKSNRK